MDLSWVLFASVASRKTAKIMGLNVDPRVWNTVWSLGVCFQGIEMTEEQILSEAPGANMSFRRSAGIVVLTMEPRVESELWECWVCFNGIYQAGGQVLAEVPSEQSWSFRQEHES